MSSNQKIYQDQDSDFDDWLELKNVGNEPVNISGYYLSDNSADLTQWQFDSTQDFIIKPNNHLLIWADDVSVEKITENRLEYLSFHDELTALYNRRYFENELEKFNQSRKLPISIIIGDLDNLKYINDNFGHKTGDKYLVKAAKIMKDNFRNEDIIARIGGDEFAAILPDTNTETAAKISERIRSECRKCEKYNNFRISIGHATKNSKFDDLTEVFIKADQEMYQNKKENKVDC